MGNHPGLPGPDFPDTGFPRTLSLGHFVIRSLMFEAAATVGLDPDGLSFTGCFQILKCRLPECDGKTAASFEAWYEGLLWELQGERTELRRNRINPRD